MALTDAAKAVIAQRALERHERLTGTRPLFDSARTKGDYLLAEPGCEIFARDSGDVTNIRMRADGQPRGGIIVEIASGSEVTGDGEIIQRRAFRCIDYDPRVPLRRATTVLTEAQIDPSTFTAPNIARIRGLYRRMCREIGARSGVASSSEIDMVLDAARLAAIVGSRLG